MGKVPSRVKFDEEEEDIIGTEGEVGAGSTDALAASLEQRRSSVTKRE